MKPKNVTNCRHNCRPIESPKWHTLPSGFDKQLRNSSTTRPPKPDVREEDRILCRMRQNPLHNENVMS